MSLVACFKSLREQASAASAEADPARECHITSKVSLNSKHVRSISLMIRLTRGVVENPFASECVAVSESVHIVICLMLFGLPHWRTANRMAASSWAPLDASAASMSQPSCQLKWKAPTALSEVRAKPPAPSLPAASTAAVISASTMVGCIHANSHTGAVSNAAFNSMRLARR